MCAHGTPGSGDGQSSRPGQGGGNSGSSLGFGDFYGNIPSHWTGEEAGNFQGTPNPYGMGSFPAGAVYTPISLPDNTFTHARQSPVPSHESQEYNAPVPSHGLGITASFPAAFPQAIASGLDYAPEGVEYTRPAHPASASRSQQTARRSQVSILPHPEGLQRLEEERQQSQPRAQTQQQQPITGQSWRHPQRQEEDKYVDELRDQGVSWKRIAQMFSDKFNKPSTVAQLQMRRARQRERVARWDENDIQLLIRARDQFEQEKYTLIAQKVQELGAGREYTAAQCEAQLRVLERRQREEESGPSRRTRKRRRTSERSNE